jgi:two-component sensor histidine kinase
VRVAADIGLAIASIIDISDQRKAEAAVAADLRAMTLLRKLGGECVREGAKVDECLNQVVEAAIAIAGADKGILQTLNPDTRALTIAARRGFREPFLKFFESLDGDADLCTATLKCGKQLIVGDVNASELFYGHPPRRMLLDAGARAMISTPLMSSKGLPLGIVSTFFSGPHEPSERESRYTELLARLAADYLERKRSDELTKILISEVHHRNNNLLAVVQSIIRRTLTGEYTPARAREVLEARLAALARANQRLANSNWSGLGLTEIVLTELNPFSNRVQIEGPHIGLNPQQGQNFALMVHELATNATKYGALSNESGTVRIFWTVTRNGREHALKFKWEERGGPLVLKPTRRGFGSALINSAFPSVRFNYAPEGLSCEIDVKLSADRADQR